jgi:hypothetical protein
MEPSVKTAASTIPTFPERWHEWVSAKMAELGYTNDSLGARIGRGGTHVSGYRQRHGHLPASTISGLLADAFYVSTDEVRERLNQERRIRANETETQELHAPTGNRRGVA